MPQYQIQHITEYIYPAPASYLANQIKLFPINDEFQKISHHIIRITQNPGISIEHDFIGNKMGTFTILEPLDKLTIDSEFVVNTFERPAYKNITETALLWQQIFDLQNDLFFSDYLEVQHNKFNVDILNFLKLHDFNRYEPFQIISKINNFIFSHFKYIKDITTVETTIEEIWNLKAGVCQDFTHFMLSVLRLIKIPCRYVSGYICSATNELRGDGATHAWLEAYLPDYGWLGFDPTNNCMAGTQHVKLAVGRNFNDCSPVKGTYRGPAHHILSVKVNIKYENQLIINSKMEYFNEIKNTNSSITTDKSAHQHQQQQ